MSRTIIDSVDIQGRGVAKIDGKVTFVEDAITGEFVECDISKKKLSFNNAKVSTLLKSSPHRVVPQCEYFGRCGGCSMQHMDIGTQVSAKQRVLEDNFARIGKTKPGIIFAPIHGKQWAYRRRARLSARFVQKKNDVLVGFREKKSSFVTDMSSCNVLPKKMSLLIDPLRQLIFNLSIRNKIPQIEFADSESSTGLIFRVMDELSVDDKLKLKEFANIYKIQIFLQPAGIESIFLYYPKKNNPSLSYFLPEFNLNIKFLPTHFTQVNFEINRVLVRRAISLLQPKPGEIIGDYFCGLGNFSLPVAARGAFVKGYESNSSLIDQASLNARENGLSSNTSFAVTDLFSDDPKIAQEINMLDKCLIDPPRDGASQLVAKIRPTGPKVIVYISCNSATLARDAGVLVNVKGYKCKGVGIVNMFPNTSHFEAIAMFVR
ncbi:MAG: 23S rRNA (uracil(1939)-C(5))-methyltransferase RlmD [Proteobacteria bacterium]|nr:23S rRNA (uracil(1939)-C(5))-methyltransferase RlmD [Pseudomonadota bacterium]